MALMLILTHTTKAYMIIIEKKASNQLQWEKNIQSPLLVNHIY